MSGEAERGARELGLLGLRIAAGVLLLAYGWAQFSHPAGVIATWSRLHLPLPGLLGPVQGAVEFVGGLLLVLGPLTRRCGLLQAPDIVGALAFVRLGHTAFRGGWAIERQAFWIALALLCTGAGAVSLDRLTQGRARSVSSRSFRGAVHRGRPAALWGGRRCRPH